MKYTNRQLLDLARERARAARLPQPRTKTDIENLTGFAFLGSMPDPQELGQTYHVNLTTWRNR